MVITIPAGVDTFTNIRLPNQGDAGPYNSTRGHLWVKPMIEPDTRFTREGSDVHVTAELPLSTAVLGGVVDVPTLKGKTRKNKRGK